jgi:hypothetical protein
VTVQLIEAAHARQRWTESYERNIGDVLTLQGEVARSITQAIKMRLTREEREVLARARPEQVERAAHPGASAIAASPVGAIHGEQDPDFEAKVSDIIGLYLEPPQHAAVFCVDEKTAIQAPDRLDPVLPLSPGRAERYGFEYYRHGTLSLYAAPGHQDR